MLETANIKLGDVASDVLGASGRAMLRAIIAGERDPEKLAALAQGLLQRKEAQLREGLLGRITAHHVFMFQGLLSHIEFLEQQIALFDTRIKEQTRPFGAALARLDTITGVARRSAEQILAELGDAMSRFPTTAHAASWTGICPGNNEGAGKHKSGKTCKGNRWLRPALMECARGAVRARDGYPTAQYHRIARRRGDKKAIVAVGHSILVAARHILRNGGSYRDLGRDYFDRLNRGHLIRYLPAATGRTWGPGAAAYASAGHNLGGHAFRGSPFFVVILPKIVMSAIRRTGKPRINSCIGCEARMFTYSKNIGRLHNQSLRLVRDWSPTPVAGLDWHRAC